MVRITTIAINTMISAAREINYLRMRWVGHCLHLESSVSVDPELELSQIASLRADMENALRVEIPSLAEMTISISTQMPDR